MPILVRDVYTRVCDNLLEPGGLTGLTLTEGDFISMLNQAVSEFMTLGGYVKTLPVQAQLGVGLYQESTPMSVIKQLAFAESMIPQNSGFFWDQSNYRWQLEGPGTPQEWRQDQIPESYIEVRPKPAWTGGEPEFESQGFYGLVSSVTAIVDDIQSDPLNLDGMLGTLSETDYGDMYVETEGAFYGTFAEMTVSYLNLLAFGIQQPVQEIKTLDDAIAGINPMFIPHLTFIVLGYVYQQDGEVKNMALAKYFNTRAEEGSRLLASVMDEKQ